MIGGPDETRLLRKFTDLYPVTSRPVLNESETLRVEFGVHLVQIRELVSQFSVCHESQSFCHVACL